MKAGPASWSDAQCRPPNIPDRVRLLSRYRKEAAEDLWHPDLESNSGVDEYSEFLCGGCPRKTECLAYADDNDIEYGIWGGVLFTPLKRRERRRVERVGEPGGTPQDEDTGEDESAA